MRSAILHARDQAADAIQYYKKEAELRPKILAPDFSRRR
jgi:hypothetical protein